MNCYMMLFGVYPFNLYESVKHMLTKQMPKQKWVKYKKSKISPSANDLLKRTMEFDVGKRIDIETVEKSV